MDKVNCSDIYDKSVYVRLVSGVTCGASVVGSVLIILSYLCFKRLRTRVRQILLHISVADAGVATANLVGAAVYFDRYYHVQCEKDPDDGTIIYQLVSPRLYISSLCKAQAFVALYCTYNSILWTVSLAVYLYFILVHHGTLNAKRFLMFAYFFCYGMPLLLSLWALLTGRLGYSPYNSAGWCTVILVDPIHPQERDLFMGVIGYDMWIYLAMVLVSVLYLAMKTFLGEELERTKKYVPRKQFWKAVNVLEYKFLTIPIAFFLLRLPTSIINLFYVYIQIGQIPQPLVYLSGVGDSGQGFVNAILFVFLTKPVRNSFLQFICCCRRHTTSKTTSVSDTQYNIIATGEGDPLIPSRQVRNLSRSLNSNSRSGAITPDYLTASQELPGNRE